jgi:serine/threonine protein phosphatase PrpC
MLSSGLQPNWEVNQKNSTRQRSIRNYHTAGEGNDQQDENKAKSGNYGNSGNMNPHTNNMRTLPQQNELPNLKVPQISLPVGRMSYGTTMAAGAIVSPKQPNGRRSRSSSRQSNGTHRSNRRKQQQHFSENTSDSNGNTVLPQIASSVAGGSSSQKSGGMSNLSSSAAPKETPATFSNNYTLGEEHSFSACTSIKGLKPGKPNWTNQDNFFIFESFDNRVETKMFCVLDGHGEHGHHVSRRCREQFPGIIKSVNMDISQAFGIMQNDLNSCEYDVKCSGATCVLAVMQGAKLSVYNCGDSRAVLGRRNTKGQICAHALSLDHKPDRPDERKRVLACGGHLGCRQALVNQPGRGPVSMPVGPCRVWYQHRGETLGLAMSRSLGDSVVHKCGVSAEPEILEHMIDSNDEFIIIATDGVWDVVDNNYATQMVASFVNKFHANWSSMDASHAVTKYARSRWEKMSPMVDDITCIVVKLPKG